MPHEPNCEKCQAVMTPVGKLPGVAGRPAMHVFKCRPCQRIETIPQEEARRSVTNRSGHLYSSVMR